MGGVATSGAACRWRCWSRWLCGIRGRAYRDFAPACCSASRRQRPVLDARARRFLRPEAWVLPELVPRPLGLRKSRPGVRTLWLDLAWMRARPPRPLSIPAASSRADRRPGRQVAGDSKTLRASASAMEGPACAREAHWWRHRARSGQRSCQGHDARRAPSVAGTSEFQACSGRRIRRGSHTHRDQHGRVRAIGRSSDCAAHSRLGGDSLPTPQRLPQPPSRAACEFNCPRRP